MYDVLFLDYTLFFFLLLPFVFLLFFYLLLTNSDEKEMDTLDLHTFVSFIRLFFFSFFCSSDPILLVKSGFYIYEHCIYDSPQSACTKIIPSQSFVSFWMKQTRVLSCLWLLTTAEQILWDSAL